MQNRLQFRHDCALYKDINEIKNVLNNLKYYDEYSLYAEPLVFRYGTNDNINIALVLGSKGDGSNKESSYFIIDTANIEKSIAEINDAAKENTDAFKKLSNSVNVLSKDLNKATDKLDETTSDVNKLNAEIIKKINSEDIKLSYRRGKLYLLGEKNKILSYIETDEFEKDGFINDIRLSDDKQSINVTWNEGAGNKVRTIPLRNLKVGTNSEEFLHIDHYNNKIDVIIGNDKTNGLVTSNMLNRAIDKVYDRIECLSKLVTGGVEGGDISDEVYSLITSLKNIVDKQGLEITNINEDINRIKNDINDINGKIDEVSEKVSANEKAIDDINEVDGQQNERLDAIDVELDFIVDAISELNEGNSELGESLKETSKKIAEISKDIKGIKDDNEEQDKKIEELEKRTSSVEDDVTDMKKEAEETISRIEGIEKVLPNITGGTIKDVVYNGDSVVDEDGIANIDATYKTAINDDAKVANIFGDMKAKDLTGQTLNTILDMLLFPLEYPNTPTLPKVEVVIPSYASEYIIGSSVSIGSVSARLKDGSFNATFEQPKAQHISEMTDFKYTTNIDGYVPTVNVATISEVNGIVVKLGENRITYTASSTYTAPSNKPFDSHGNETTKTGKNAPEGSATWIDGTSNATGNIIYYGVYPCFTNIIGNTLGDEANTQCNVSNRNTITLNNVPSEVVSKKPFMFLYPTGRTVDFKVKDLSGQYVTFSSDNYTITETDVNVNGTAYKYNKLVTDGSTGENTYKITLSKDLDK